MEAHNRNEHSKDQDPAKPQANTPTDDTDTAHRSGQFGADKPGFGKEPPATKRPSDKHPNQQGAEYEEGGQYPGKRPEGK